MRGSASGPTATWMRRATSMPIDVRIRWTSGSGATIAARIAWARAGSLANVSLASRNASESRVASDAESSYSGAGISLRIRQFSSATRCSLDVKYVYAVVWVTPARLATFLMVSDS